MKKLGIIPVKADFTKPNEEISEWLKRHGKAGVPMYVLIPQDSGKEDWTLPELLTPGMVVEALRQAAAQAIGGN